MPPRQNTQGNGEPNVYRIGNHPRLLAALYEDMERGQDEMSGKTLVVVIIRSLGKVER